MMHKPIKIFVDAHILDKGYHGTHTYVRDLYKQLLFLYPDLDVYFGTYDPALVTSIFPESDRVHILPYKNIRPTYLRFLSDIPAYIRKYRFDYAHYQYVGVPWKTSCVSIVTLHDVLYKDYPWQFPLLYRWVRTLIFGNSLRRAGVKTTVSGYSRNRIAFHYRIPEEQIHVISNTVAPSSLMSRQTATERIAERYGLGNYILCVSRMEPRKNQLLLLDKYLSLHLYKEGIPLVFIGSPSLSVPGFEQRLRGLSPVQRASVHWFRQVSPEDLRAFYGACRVFIYPSGAEGFGLPPLEAALCRTAVLCSRNTAMESYRFFEPYTFDPSGAHELEDKLLDLVRNPPGEAFLQQVFEQVSELYAGSESAHTFYSLILKSAAAWDYPSAY
jgi:glycosyltransferase involved in cell wall biosynthesis